MSEKPQNLKIIHAKICLVKVILAELSVENSTHHPFMKVTSIQTNYLQVIAALHSWKDYVIQRVCYFENLESYY